MTTLLICFGFAVCVYLVVISAGFFRQHVKKTPAPYAPFVSVIIPCKGTDPEFIQFLNDLQKQTYKKAEYLFCLASATDPAVATIKSTLHNLPYHIIISKRIDNTSEKNQNIIMGLESINKATSVVAFVDSDGLLDETYVQSLIDPLQDDRYVCASTYRHYHGRTVGSLVTKYWNAFSLGFKSFPPLAWVWGGGFAVRTSDLSRLDIPSGWIGILGDDQPLNRHIRKLGLKTFSVSHYAHSTCAHSLWDSVRWITRQSFFAQRYFKPLHYVDIGSIAVFFFYLICLLWTGNLLFLMPFIGFFLSIAICISKYGTPREWLYLPLIYVMIIFATLYATIVTPFMKKLQWGGIVYTVDKNGRVIRREP